MKTIVLILALFFLASGSVAQSNAHEYVSISLSSMYRQLVVDSLGNEQRVVDLKELNGKTGSDMRSALDMVRVYELQGWELYDFECATGGGLEIWYYWLMRKPIQ